MAEHADGPCWRFGHAWEYRKARAGSVCAKCGQGDQDWIDRGGHRRTVTPAPSRSRDGRGGLGAAAPVAATPGAGLFGGGTP